VVNPELATLVLEIASIAVTLLGAGFGAGIWVVRQTLVTKGELQALAIRVREDGVTLRQILDLHKAEDAAYHARADGEVVRLREMLTVLPTHREMAEMLRAMERMRVDITAGLGTVSGDIKGINARMGAVQEALTRTQNIVDRHEAIISDAAARQGGDDVTEKGDIIAEWKCHVRLAILIALMAAPSSSLNESILTDHLNGPKLRFKARRAQVREEMRWLDREGLACLEGAEDDYLVLTLKQAGEDIVAGRSQHHGVKSPALD